MELHMEFPIVFQGKFDTAVDHLQLTKRYVHEIEQNRCETTVTFSSAKGVDAKKPADRRMDRRSRITGQSSRSSTARCARRRAISPDRPRSGVRANTTRTQGRRIFRSSSGLMYVRTISE
jgi:hypothetical protein